MHSKNKKKEEFTAFEIVFEKITQKFLAQNNIKSENIKALWKVIFAQSEIGTNIQPIKIVKKKNDRSILFVAVDKSQVVKWQHQTQIIIDKINKFFQRKIIVNVKVTGKKGKKMINTIKMILFTIIIITSYTKIYHQNYALAQDKEIFTKEEMKNAQILEDIYIGNENAPVTIYEYISLTCSHCAYFHKNSFYQIKNEFIDTGMVKYIIREYPLDGIARSYAVLARCAEKDKFFNIYGILLDEQSKWIRAQQPLTTFKGYAKKFGFDDKRIKDCLKDTELLENIYANTDKARQILQIKATPTFFINGEKIEGAISIQEIRSIIQKKLQDKK